MDAFEDLQHDGPVRPPFKLRLVDWIRFACMAVFVVAMLAPIPYAHVHQERTHVGLGHNDIVVMRSDSDSEYTYLETLNGHQGEWPWAGFVGLCALLFTWELLERRFGTPERAAAHFRSVLLIVSIFFVSMRHFELVQFDWGSSDTRTALLAGQMVSGAALVLITATIVHGYTQPRPARPRVTLA